MAIDKLKLNLTPEKREELVKKFNALDSIDDKFEFWTLNLQYEYCRRSRFDNDEISPFLIKAIDSKEREFINNQCLQQYIENYEFQSIAIFNSIEGAQDDLSWICMSKNRGQVLRLDEFKENFNKELESIQNKSAFYDIEIEKIKGQVNYDNSEDYQYLKNAYFDYYLRNISPDLSNEVLEIEKLILIENGYVLACFHKYIDEFIKPKETSELFTHLEQILIMDYLFISKEFENNTKKAEFFAPIIRRTVEKTRQIISYSESKKNKKNLTKIESFFSNFGFDEIVKKIQSDIKKQKK